MDRYWFYTWRTYGTWLPGEDGFVGYYHSQHGRRMIDNVPGELPTEAIPPLARYAQENMAGEPVALTREQAEAVLTQFHETAAYRGWAIDAVAVMVNHIHLVFGVPGDPDPSEILKSWKSYASRALNRLGPKPKAPRWFADSGSKRPLKAEPNRIGAICYVRDQAGPLLVWLSDEAAELVADDPPTSIADATGRTGDVSRRVMPPPTSVADAAGRTGDVSRRVMPQTWMTPPNPDDALKRKKNPATDVAGSPESTP